MSRPAVVCRQLQPQPLASYLGGLGLLRALTSGLGPSTRAAWGQDGLRVEGIDEQELLDFMCRRWPPSPVLSPWNNASGFYPSSKGRLAAAALEAIGASRDERFASLRTTISRVRELVPSAEAPSDEQKAQFISKLRDELPDEALHWLDAVSISIDGAARMLPLLGSGGNEGVLDYAGLYLRSLQETILHEDQARSLRLLRAAMLGDACSDLVERPGGQFDPGTAGGFNTGPGFESKGLPNNPWAFLLLIEGALMWSSGYASRQVGEQSAYRLAVSPFTVRHVAAGYSSAAKVEDDAAKVRAEIWVPVWTRPASHAEVLRFIAEGRVEVRGPSGARRARDSFDFADAVSSLGIDRGVGSFVRYAFTKRRGDSYLALPTGVVRVTQRREADLLRQADAPLRELDVFLSRFKGDGPPPGLSGLRRNINEARFEVASRGGADAMLRLVRSLGALERVLSRRDPSKEPRLRRPLAGLGSEWVSACGDSPEVRIAAALAAIGRTGRVGPLRAYLSPIDPDQDWKYAPGSRSVAWTGPDLAGRMASVLRRRLLDVQVRKSPDPRNPLWGPRQVGLQDIADFLEPGLLDEALLEDLIFGFSWVEPASGGRSVARRPAPVPRAYAVLKLLFLPHPLQLEGEDQRLSPGSALVPLLLVGRVQAAVELASRMLRVRGFSPRSVVHPSLDDSTFGRRLAAALLIPVSHTSTIAAHALLPRNQGSGDADVH